MVMMRSMLFSLILAGRMISEAAGHPVASPNGHDRLKQAPDFGIE
jgi:hypothetical protein